MAETKPSATKSDWRICLECGNRYVAHGRKYQRSWCSRRCESAAFRSWRDRLLGPGGFRSYLR